LIRILALLPLLGALALIGWLGWPILAGKDPSVLPSALLDKPLPEFDLPALQDGAAPLRTADFRTGAPVLLNVFASWCAPCRAEIPLLSRHAADGTLTVIGLAYKDKPEATRDFLETLGNPYSRIGVDRDGRVGIDLGVYGVPETYVIDGEGRIRHRHVGEVTERTVQDTLLPLLRELGG